MSPLNPSPATGVLLVIGSCLSLQFGAALADGLFPHLGPWGVTTLRLGLAALFLLAVARPAAWGWSRQAWTGVVLLGASLGAMNGFFFASIERLPLAVAVSFEFIGPLVLAAVLSRSARDMLWVGIAAAGMVLLGLESALGAESLDPVGIAFALVAGACTPPPTGGGHRPHRAPVPGPAPRTRRSAPWPAHRTLTRSRGSTSSA